jgi:plasmid stabilization system protein ParE
MKVHWTETALSHLDAIHAYISGDSPQYARKMIDRLTRRSQQIALFPRSGRLVPEYEVETIRELIEGPFRLIYRIQPERIDVLAVVHEARSTIGITTDEQ